MEIPPVSGCREAVSSQDTGPQEGGLGGPQGNGGAAALGKTRILPLSPHWLLRKDQLSVVVAVGPKAGILCPFLLLRWVTQLMGDELPL